MEHSIQKQVIHPSTRFGLHYFPDSFHYSDQDLEKWLPKIKELGASWLVLIAEEKRAIPEGFLKSLIKSDITPILHFPFSCNSSISHNELSPLLEAYSHWGVKNIIFFDRPNQRSAWGDTEWAKENLIERFIEKFLPLFQEAKKHNLTTVFPPLEPGGQYWDTIFLRESLELMKTRISVDLLSEMVLSAYAWDNNKPINWGSGGFERWPMAKPYFTPPNIQDQRGFRIYEWYQFIGQNILQQNPPILLLQAGMPGLPLQHPNYIVNSKIHSDKVITILKSLAGENVYDPLFPEEALEPIPEQVIACNFWLLTTEKDDPLQSHAWFTPSLQPSLPAQSVMNWIREESLESTADETGEDANEDISAESKTFPFSRYLLFPSLEWLLDREQRDIIQSYIEAYQPIIGFSLEEAKKSAVVTVVGDSSDFSDEQLDQIRQHGCFVSRLSLEKVTKTIDMNMEQEVNGIHH